MKKQLMLGTALLSIGLVLAGCSASNSATNQEEKAKQQTVEQNKKEADEAKKVEEQKAAEEKAKQEEVAKKAAEEEQAKQAAAQAQQQTQAANLLLESVMVTRVVDGDTIEVSGGRKVRLIGINTPESTTKHETYGKEASNYTTSKLQDKQVWLQKDVSKTDRYQRLLRIVWLAVPSNDMDENEIRTKMFNADLVLNGYAEPSTYPPDVKYSEFFVKFAREAREANKGLWAYGPDGTTKGDLDPKNTPAPAPAPVPKPAPPTPAPSPQPSPAPAPAPAPSPGNESFANCTELRKVYPNGVPAGHPAYQPKLDRDKDNFACEKN